MDSTDLYIISCIHHHKYKSVSPDDFIYLLMYYYISVLNKHYYSCDLALNSDWIIVLGIDFKGRLCTHWSALSTKSLKPIKWGPVHTSVSRGEKWNHRGVLRAQQRG
jgi:hypothetical protein